MENPTLTIGCFLKEKTSLFIVAGFHQQFTASVYFSINLSIPAHYYEFTTPLLQFNFTI